MMATQRIDPAKTTAAARSFAGFARELGETEAAAHVEDALARTESGLFRLVVAGEVKKGKSSLVNTLLGVPDLLPTSDDVATSTVFKVVHGTERRYRAFFRDLDDAEAEPEPRAITLEEAVALGTEDGWADTSERLIKVLWWPQRPHRAARRGPGAIPSPKMPGGRA